MDSSNTKKVIIVTGANRGIGYGIVEQFLIAGNTKDLVIIGTTRDIENGMEANEKLKLNYPGASNSLIWHQLDVANSKSIEDFATKIKNDFQGIDVLINNAGVAKYETGKEEEDTLKLMESTFETNVYGVINMCENFLDIIRNGGHIINISSRMGQIKLLDEKKRKDFLDIENATMEKFEELKNDFFNSSKNHSWEKDGWLNYNTIKNNGYSVSKAFLNFYTRMLDRRVKLSGRNIKINCCSPGHCRTRMTGDDAPKSYLEGADTPYWLANFPSEDNSLSGNFYAERILIPFYV